MPSAGLNLPSGQISLHCPARLLGTMYLLGQGLWLLTLGLDLWTWYLGLFISIGFGFQIREFRHRIEQYSAIGLHRGSWFIVDQSVNQSVNQSREIQVCLNFDSVILPGMLLLNFKDRLNKRYCFLIVPAMVEGKECFSWLSRYAKLTPVFQSKIL